jgi:hypothetical protein
MRKLRFALEKFIRGDPARREAPGAQDGHTPDQQNGPG